MRTTPRTSMAGLVLAGLVLGAAGCAAATSGPAEGLTATTSVTQASARQAFDAFVTTDDVARAAGDESLELSLVGQAQLPLTVSAYEQADYTGTPAPRYRYGTAALYVPQLKSYPLWFVAVAPRTPLGGGTTRTAIMTFSRLDSSDSWHLVLSTLLAPGAALPRIALDPSGHAIPLATFEQGLLVSPNSVGAAQAATADDGPAAASAAVVAAGPYTTGIYAQTVAARRHAAPLGLTYDSLLQGSSFPLYALKTSGGGALVLYSLAHGTVVERPVRHRTAASPRIQVPPAFAPILYATGRLVIQSELDITETDEYAAEVPPVRPGGAHPGLVQIIAADGAPTSAAGN